MKIAIAQINLTVGDLAGNADRICSAARNAMAQGASLLLTTELSLCGYPPEDLLLKRAFVRHNRMTLDRIALNTSSCVAVVGFVHEENGHLYNAVGLCREGGLMGIYKKRLLPNYAVFDEERYFEPGPEMVDGRPAGLFWMHGLEIGVSI